MTRHLPRLLLTGALLSPLPLYALGLGEIRPSSSLNQPFDAEIELISPTSEELSSLKVGLASNELFARYGIDRPAYLSGFNFAVSRTRDGRASIKVTSNRSVTEPFVTILVEASWARGRLLREYTVLLDPPVFMPTQPESAAPVTSAQSGAQTEGRIERQPAPQARPEPQPQPAAESTKPAPASEQPASEPVARTAASSAAPGSEYTVQRNDTLWRIASGANPGPRRVVNQTMIALFRANPAAFDGNINKLRAGSVLRIPELTEIEAVSTSEASAEVARQAAEWSGATPTQAAAEADRLRLVTPAETPAAPSAAAPATPAQSAPERPGAAAASGTATTPDKRLEVSSPGLADVQRNVGETPAEQPPPAATETQQPSAEQPAAEAPPATPEQEPAKAAPPASPVAQEAPGPSLLDRIGDFWWVLVVLGLLVIGVVLAFVRRRREESTDSLDSLSTLNFEPRVERAARAAAVDAATVTAKGRDRADSFLVDDGEEDRDDYVEPPAPVTAVRTEAPKTRRIEPAPEPIAPLASAAAPKPGEDTLSSETAVRFDQQDALAEADFHMAYGLYDQAADLVKIAIDREPSRRDLKLKLLEIYFVWGNKDLFLDTARDLHSSRDAGGAGEWDKVLIMGKQIAPDDAMFKGEAGATRVDLVDVNLEGGENRVDVDLFAEPDADKPAGLDLEFTTGEHKAPSSAQADLGDGDLDFLLDEPKRGSDDEPTRELDPLARTQETPTIESPMIDRTAQTVREKTDKGVFAKAGTDQTAELSLDDLGLDVDSLEHAGSLEDTTSLEKDTGETEVASRPLRDDEMTQLAPSISSFDRTMEAPRPVDEKFDIESTGTIYIDQVDLGGGDTVEQQRPDVDSTASMQRLSGLDLDLDNLSGATESNDTTVRHPSRGHNEDDRFSSDVFAERTSEVPRIDLDVGEPLSSEDLEPTNKQITNEMELSELEPVTMSEVGTKLDLARAYMDMGDPDGARSILEEVLAEGNPNQKQEAQRLIESIR